MSPSNPLRLLSAALLLAGLSACDRAPRSQAATPAAAKPATTAPASAIEAGATTTPMPDATVALSGAVRDLPPATTPDSMLGKSAANTPSAAVRPPPPVDTTPRTAPPGETAAMREFREAQERRDRELLERDMDASRDEVARNEDGLRRDGAVDDRYPPADPRDPDADYDEALPPDDSSLDDPSLDEDLPAYDEDLPPEDEELPPGEGGLPPEDEDLRWDPATGTWR
jgi:hypothetical protein